MTGTQAPSAQGGVSPAGPTSVSPKHGLTATSISIGVITADGFDKASDAMGIKAGVGSSHAEAAAVIDYLNVHGGIAGRKIVPVYYDVNIANAEANPAAELQNACTAMTQDNHVFAVATAVALNSESFYTCLSRAGVISSQAGEHFDAPFFQKFADYFYMSTEINVTRVMADNVDALYAAGYFQGWNPTTGAATPGPVKVGLMRQDNAGDARVRDQAVKPALARHGLVLADDFATGTSASQMNAQYQAAVLRFAAEGITHVLFTPASTPLYFMLSANNQNYRPRYGLNSRSSPGALLQTSVPVSQLHGSMGMGWQQYNDVDGAHDPGPPSARARLCLQLMQKAGQDTSARATALAGLWYCDTLFFLHDALAKAPSVTVAGFRAGAESLSRYEAASTFVSSFAPDRLHDGARDYRLFSFLDTCSCYEYTTGLRTAP